MRSPTSTSSSRAPATRQPDKTPAAGMSAAWAAARAANGTDEDEDGEKDRFSARGAKVGRLGKIESDWEKEEKAKFASRKSGTRIAEVEKRPVVARAQTVCKSTGRTSEI